MHVKIESPSNVTVNGKSAQKMFTNAKLLGLNIDEKLSFEIHVDELCKKLAKRIAVLRKIRSYLPLRQRKLFYNSMIRSIMNYVNVIWTTCNKESQLRVLRLQKRAARVILFTQRQTPSVDLFNKLCWLPFYEDANITRCSFVFKCLQSSLPSYLNDLSRYTRETEGGRTFSVITSKLWNSLPLPLRKSQSVGSFRHGLWKLKFDEQQVILCN